MKNLYRAPKTLLATLCLSASFIVPAQASEIKLLPEMSASEIAGDTVRSFDSRTGVSIVTAPTFDPFEQDDSLAGTAALRTGPSEVTIDGQQVVGGAYLDLKMIYTSASDDPYDLRGFERSVYVSGEPVDRILQDVRTLDCASNTTEVVYEDNYYNSYDSHGYLAGLYLLLPRYRGHRGYWSGRYRGPNSNWSNWRRHGSYSSGYDSLGYHGTRRGYGYGGGHRSGSYGGTGRHGTRGTGTRGTGTRGTGTGRTGTRGTDGTRGTGGTRGTSRSETRRNNSIIGGSRENQSYQRQRGVVTGSPLQRSRGAERESERTQTERAEGRNTRRSSNTSRTRGTSRTRSTDRVRTNDRGRNADRSRAGVKPSGRGSNPAGRAPTPIARQAAPIPIARQAAPVVRQAPAPRRATVKPSSSQPSQPSKARESSKPRSSSKSRNRKVDRAVDRSFRKDRGRASKKMNFFPAQVRPMQFRTGGYSQVSTDVYQSYRCVREESVTLHIPQERLDAARFDGLTLVVIDNNDRDVPIYLPPNYIEGFRQATGRSSAYSPPSGYSVPSTTVVTPQNSGTTTYGYPNN